MSAAERNSLVLQIIDIHSKIKYNFQFHRIFSERMSWQLVTGEPLVIAKSNGATGIGSVISNVKKVV